jgi:hypothetical protein
MAALTGTRLRFESDRPIEDQIVGARCAGAKRPRPTAGNTRRVFRRPTRHDIIVPGGRGHVRTLLEAAQMASEPVDPVSGRSESLVSQWTFGLRAAATFAPPPSPFHPRLRATADRSRYGARGSRLPRTRRGGPDETRRLVLPLKREGGRKMAQRITTAAPARHSDVLDFPEPPWPACIWPRSGWALCPRV